MKKITKIWFNQDHIYGLDQDGKVLTQSLLWYQNLLHANEEERNDYETGLSGFHWSKLNEDISFESFYYDDAEPSALQRFFLTHKEINVGEFAKRIGINPSLLRNYINGFKKPSPEREKLIMDSVRELGKELIAIPS